MSQYKVVMYLSGPPSGLDSEQLDRWLFASAKHSDFHFEVDKILEEPEGEE